MSRDANVSQVQAPQREFENCRVSRGVAQTQDETHSSSAELCIPADPPLHGPGEHWLALAARRMVELERRIALTNALVVGLLGGILLGGALDLAVTHTTIGFAIGGLTGAALGRLWHAFR